MKICCIGNSHGASLKRAIDAGWSRGDATVDIMVIPGSHGPRLEFRDGTATPTDTRKMRTTAGPKIRFSDYDAIWVAGCGAVSGIAGAFEKGVHPLNVAGCFEWGGTVSRRYMSRTITAAIESHPSWKACQEASRAGVMVGILPWPRPARRVLDRVPFGDTYTASSADVLRAYFDMHDASMRHLAGTLENAVLVTYPDETTADGFTADRYIVERDPYHANEDLGRISLDLLYAGTTALMARPGRPKPPVRKGLRGFLRMVRGSLAG